MFRSLIAAALLLGASLAHAQPNAKQPQDRDIAQLRAELAELRARLTEAEARAAVNEQLLGQINVLNQQVAALRAQLAQAQAQSAERAAEIDRAVESVVVIEQQLITGDTTNADATLYSAGAVLSAVARTQVEAARRAIDNKDLATARWFLIQAISEQRSRP